MNLFRRPIALLLGWTMLYTFTSCAVCEAGLASGVARKVSRKTALGVFFWKTCTTSGAVREVSPNPCRGCGEWGWENARDIGDANDYDAFGNLIAQTGSTPNNYLFAGEPFDPALGVYYNRARFYDQQLGRFWSMDTYEGDPQSPASLHKYLYAGANPVDRRDPNGEDFDLGSMSAAMGAMTSIASMAVLTIQNVASAIYVNLYRVPEIIEDLNTAATYAVGTFEILRILGTNVLNAAESYSSVPIKRGNEFEQAAGANLGPTFPAIDYFDKDSGTAIQIRSTTQTSSPESLLAVVRKGVNRVNNLPLVLSGTDRNGDPLSIARSDIKAKGLLIGIPAKPLPWFASFIQQVKEISESEKVTIMVQFVEGLEGETLEK